MITRNKKTQDIINLIPHKAPAVMVDDLLEWNGHKATSILLVTPNNIYVKQGEFQVDGLIEHIAQTVALKMAVRSTESGGHNKESSGYLAAIQRFNLVGKVHVNDTIETTIEITKNLGTILKAVSVSTVHKKPLAESEMTFYVKSKS